MHRRAETHKPGKVTKIVDGVEAREELAEITLEEADPMYGKLRIVNFLMDEMGQKHRLQEGDGVDVIVGSDEVQPEKVKCHQKAQRHGTKARD
jgi:hypothetical protein